MEKPTFKTKAVDADLIASIKTAGDVYAGKAVVGRVVNHVAGSERVEVLRLEDGSEVILKGDAAVTKWPSIEYPRDAIDTTEEE